MGTRVTFEMVCHETRQTVWVGNGTKAGMLDFWPEVSDGAAAALREFLLTTAGKPVVLMPSCDVPAGYENLTRL